jgi:2-polyprenyl-6-hydroxyphenyl methylase/3-demethylubiquinone-9 3-methyltransferase
VIARTCAKKAGLAIEYRLATPEEVAMEGTVKYQIVLALEVVEHVEDLPVFLDALFGCARKDGTVVVATLNRTRRSWLTGIWLAEHVLGWLPKGTHSWDKFVKPAELDVVAQKYGFRRVRETGLTFNPLKWKWVTTRSLAVNYMIVCRR